QERVAAKLSEIPDAKSGETPVFLVLRNASVVRNAILTGDSTDRCLRPETGCVEMGKAGSELIDGARGEYMRVPRNGLIRFGCLQTLIERTPVGNSSEDARNENGIVGITETNEDLIVLLRVEVAADVELVAVLEKRRAVAISLQSGVGRRKQVEHVDR